VVRDVFSVVRIMQEGMTVLLVEQNVALALSIADRAYVMENGRIVMEGSGSDLLHRDDVRRAYLGV
jgi:branched-chain amino acid transport system ATP-binding protein